MDQARQEKINAKFYAEQAEFARVSALRAEKLAEFSYTAKLSQQASGYAAGGVDSSGSAAVTMGGTIANMLDEIFAIKKKGDLDVKLARMRGVAANQKADTLGSFGYNAMQAGGAVLGAYAKSEGFGKGFPSFLSPDSAPPSGGGGSLKYFPE
jgi:hypothetical protein